MVAAKIATMSEGRPAETRSIDLVSQDDAAGLLNVSVPSVKRAKKVQESGNEKLIADVEAGKVTVSASATVASPVSGNDTFEKGWHETVSRSPPACRSNLSELRRRPRTFMSGMNPQRLRQRFQVEDGNLRCL